MRKKNACSTKERLIYIDRKATVTFLLRVFFSWAVTMTSQLAIHPYGTEDRNFPFVVSIGKGERNAYSMLFYSIIYAPKERRILGYFSMHLVDSALVGLTLDDPPPPSRPPLQCRP